MWIDVEYHIYIYDTRIPPCDGPVGKFDSWWGSVTCLVEKVSS